MHDLLIAVAFIVIVASPAIVAAIPKGKSEDNS
jgi:hypothetical protein